MKLLNKLTIAARLILLQVAVSIVLLAVLVAVVFHFAERVLQERGIAEMERTTQRVMDMVAAYDGALRITMDKALAVYRA